LIGNRTQKSLENRFGTIKHDTRKYMGCVFQVLRLQRSKTNAKDEEQANLALYKDLPGSKGKEFKLLHCWKLEHIEHWKNFQYVPIMQEFEFFTFATWKVFI
jgi:hypothetical protein